jgi:hypothetical protein
MTDGDGNLLGFHESRGFLNQLSNYQLSEEDLYYLFG